MKPRTSLRIHEIEQFIELREKFANNEELSNKTNEEIDLDLDKFEQQIKQMHYSDPHFQYDRLKMELPTVNKELVTKQDELDKLQQELEEANSKLQAIQDYILCLANDIASETERLNHSLTHPAHGAGSIVRIVGDIGLSSQRKNNYDELIEQKGARDNLIKKINDINSQITEHENAINASKVKQEDRIKRIAELAEKLENNPRFKLEKQKEELSALITYQEQKQKIESNEFLNNYVNNPQEWFKKLSFKLNEIFDRFDINYPAEQSKSMRLCIFEMREFINAEVNESNGDEYYRKRCQLLYAVLRDMIDLTKNDNVFRQALEEVYSPIPLDITWGEAQRLYHEFNYQHKTDNDLNEAEEDIYLNATKYFTSKLNELAQRQGKDKKEINELNKVHQCGEQLLNAIEEHKRKSEDLKFCTTILNKVTYYLDHPKDMNIEKSILDLIKHDKKNQSSTGKKVCGAIIMFVGAVIAAGGILVATIAAGPSMGTGIAVGATMGVTGSWIFGAGFRLFKDGTQRGITKAVHNFVDAERSIAEREMLSVANNNKI